MGLCQTRGYDIRNLTPCKRRHWSQSGYARPSPYLRALLVR